MEPIHRTTLSLMAVLPYPPPFEPGTPSFGNANLPEMRPRPEAFQPRGPGRVFGRCCGNRFSKITSQGAAMLPGRGRGGL